MQQQKEKGIGIPTEEMGIGSGDLYNSVFPQHFMSTYKMMVQPGATFRVLIILQSSLRYLPAWMG
jgi:hypothetical protein